MGLGEGRKRKRPRTIEKGSPEHNLLSEAGVLSPEVGNRAGQRQTGMRRDSSPDKPEDLDLTKEVELEK